MGLGQGAHHWQGKDGTWIWVEPHLPDRTGHLPEGLRATSKETRTPHMAYMQVCTTPERALAARRFGDAHLKRTPIVLRPICLPLRTRLIPYRLPGSPLLYRKHTLTARNDARISASVTSG